MAKNTTEIIEGKLYIIDLEKSPCVISKAKYSLGLKKEKPINQKKCSESNWLEIVTALGKYYKASNEQIEKAKRSMIYLK